MKTGLKVLYQIYCRQVPGTKPDRYGICHFAMAYQYKIYKIRRCGTPEKGIKALKHIQAFWLISIIATLSLAACSKGTGSLTSVFGSSRSQPVKQTPKLDPLARPIQVAWTAARAQRCGFYFDANQLRSAFLSYEAGQGASGQQIKKYQQAYDFTLKTVSKKVKADPKYCKKKRRVEEIRADLQRHLQGDYTPRPRKRADTEDS